MIGLGLSLAIQILKIKIVCIKDFHNIIFTVFPLLLLFNSRQILGQLKALTQTENELKMAVT